MHQSKNNQFIEQADQYGLANIGYSFQSTFFDYDNDGDLDVYVANHPGDLKSLKMN
ncbi:MAG: VCBS repeat-containing protein [Saprospiraceae bacterium]|nr:VCBS repeat-containing protein [Saprospiraceae bacterium]